MVGLEIKKFAIGELSSVSKSFPLIVYSNWRNGNSALIYVALNTDNPLGFGIPMATDIALHWYFDVTRN